jgi:hypothetical protein
VVSVARAPGHLLEEAADSVNTVASFWSRSFSEPAFSTLVVAMSVVRALLHVVLLGQTPVL